MIGLLQRVSHARVLVAAEEIAVTGAGLLVFIGIEHDDTDADADRLLERILGYRVFGDAAGKMNLSLTETGGDLLLVPQFTLAADTRKGRRPSFSPAASPETGAELFARVVEQARRRWSNVAAGRFGAMMQVELINDGPVTFWLQT